MVNSDINNEIQLLAVRLCELYHEKKDTQLSDDELFSDGELRDVRNQLITAIMRLDKQRPDDSAAWYKICHYVIRTIPRYEFHVSEGEYNEFTHFFRKFYKNDYDDIDDEVSVYYIRNDLGGNRDDIRRIRQIHKYCDIRQVDLSKLTDKECESIRHNVFHDRISERKLRMLLAIAVRFGELESTEVADEEGIATFPILDSGEKENPDQLQFLIRELTKLTNGYLKKNQQGIVRCIYTNRFAGEMRDYTTQDHGEDFEKETPDDEKCRLRAEYLEDEFRFCSEELFDCILHLGYLSYVLQEPIPDSVYRICMNPYRVDEKGERHFTDEMIERYRGMSKGNIKKTYRPKVEEIIRMVKEYYRENG